jgi:hypothetical protein
MCLLGLHKWSAWSKVEAVNVVGVEGRVWIQTRWCKKCNKAEYRHV